MEEDIHNYSPTFKYRGTPCMSQSTPEILRFQHIPPLIFPLQSIPLRKFFFFFIKVTYKLLPKEERFEKRRCESDLSL